MQITTRKSFLLPMKNSFWYTIAVSGSLCMISIKIKKVAISYLSILFQTIY